MLQSTAESILGSFEDAQDIVQDTLEKWFRSKRESILNHRSYLFKSLVNNCQTHLRSAKPKTEYLSGIHDYLPNFKTHFEMDFEKLDQDGQVRKALEFLHSKLKPMERAVFLLREIFNLDYEVVQEIVGKKAEHCRKELSRAKKKISEEVKLGNPFSIDKAEEYFESFKTASLGRIQDLIWLLTLEQKKI